MTRFLALTLLVLCVLLIAAHFVAAHIAAHDAFEMAREHHQGDPNFQEHNAPWAHPHFNPHVGGGEGPRHPHNF